MYARVRGCVPLVLFSIVFNEGRVYVRVVLGSGHRTNTWFCEYDSASEIYVWHTGEKFARLTILVVSKETDSAFSACPMLQCFCGRVQESENLELSRILGLKSVRESSVRFSKGLYRSAVNVLEHSF